MLDSLFSDRVVEVVADVQLVPCLRPTEIHQQGTQVTLFDRRAKVRQVLHRGMAPAHFERKVKKVREAALQVHVAVAHVLLGAPATRGFGSETSPRRREHVDKMD